MSEPQPDWKCPACGKTQILKFDRCRFCGAPARLPLTTSTTPRTTVRHVFTVLLSVLCMALSLFRWFWQWWTRPRKPGAENIMLLIAVLGTMGVLLLAARFDLLPSRIPFLPSEPSERDSSYQGTSQPSRSSSGSPRQVLLRSLSLEFKRTIDTHMMQATFTIRNPTEYAAKDIEVTCEFFGKSGTMIHRNTNTIYDILPAQQTRMFELNMGFVNSQDETTVCKCTNVQLAQ